jgi:hypothetical protein
MNLPSIHVSSCATIRRSISLCAVSLLGVMASTSSRKRMHGASFFHISGVARASEEELTLASSNVSRSVFSDSPDMPDTILGAETDKNGNPSSYNHQRE